MLRNMCVLLVSALALAVAGMMGAQTPTIPPPTRAQETVLSCAVEMPSPNPLLTLFQPGNKDAPRAITGGGQRPYLGFRSCLQCHNSGIHGQIELPGGVKLDLMKEQWVLYNEFPIWAKDDKHGQAYTVLLNERSKAMGKLLGVAEVHRDQRCLACHTGFPLAEMPAKDGLVDADLVKNLDINLGVSCEGCHGPSGDLRTENRLVLKGWKDPHLLQPTLPYDKTKPWRFLSPKEKADEYGFIDVRSPAPKTKLCVSCHIGDVEQGRIVTHEMYASGHPPLPGFEIETFVNQLPRHWAEFSTKADDVQDLFIKYTADPLYSEKSYKKKSLHRTRSLLAGAVVASSEYLRYAGQLADETIKSPVKRDTWPELAAFDCYACHHDLKSPSWRQMRKPPVGTPGRPALQEWPFALAKIALKFDGVSPTEVDAKLADVHKALAALPFSTTKDFAKPAQTAAAWLYAKGRDLEKKPVTREQGVAILKEIAVVASSEVLDYDSARQLVWAFRVIEGDLKSDYPEAKKIAAILGPLGKESFHLDLRAHRKGATAVPGDKQERKTEELDLETVLPIMSRYEPARFQERFKEIAALLK